MDNTKITSSAFQLSLEELIRTSPSFLAFDPESRAQFMTKLETLDEAKKDQLKQILLEERATMSALDRQETEEKAKTRQKIVDGFEVAVIDTEKKFQRSLVQEKEAAIEAEENAQADNLLNKI